MTSTKEKKIFEPLKATENDLDFPMRETDNLSDLLGCNAKKVILKGTVIDATWSTEAKVLCPVDNPNDKGKQKVKKQQKNMA